MRAKAVIRRTTGGFVAMLAMLTGTAASSSRAAVVTVNDDGPADHASIQSAIDAAADGDTIRVAGGVYHETPAVLSRTNLALVGGYAGDFLTRAPADHPSVIDAGFAGTAVTFAGCYSNTLDGFHLVRGSGSHVHGAARWAGGFMIDDCSGMRLARLVVSNCVAGAGGGGAIYRSDGCIVEASRITDNVASNNPAGVYVRECVAELRYCVIDRNRNAGAADGAGVVSWDATAVLVNLTIADNVVATSTGFAGVVSFPTYGCVVANCIVRHNLRAGGAEEANGDAALYREASLFPAYDGPDDLRFFDRAAGDYHLRADSAALDEGCDLELAEDFDGRSVPYGAAPDVGAFEHRPDWDGDGLADVDELDLYSTSPLSADTDGDGMPDDWEVAHALSPTDEDDAYADGDGDGQCNLAEHIAGTNPADDTSFFAVMPALLMSADQAARPLLAWTGMPGRLYTVYEAHALAAASWTATTFADVPGHDGAMCFTNETPGPADRFHRVAVRCPPAP